MVEPDPVPVPAAGPPNACATYYHGLQAQCAAVLEASFAADADGLHAKAHAFAEDLSAWLRVLETRPERVMLVAAIREYQFALLALVQGQYRQAFMALRLSLELGLGTLQFSANELELRTWINGERDLNWSAILNLDDGVFSKRFAKAFFPGLADEAKHYRTWAEAAYRECSEYVHGNAPASAQLPDAIQFSDAVFADWHDKANSVRSVLMFAFAIRYAQFLTHEQLALLEVVLNEHLGHLEPIRLLLGGPMEQPNG